MPLSPAVKSFLVNAAKNAVNAVLTNSGLMAMFHSTFNFSNLHGLESILKATALVIGAREAMVYLPKLLKWSQTAD